MLVAPSLVIILRRVISDCSPIDCVSRLAICAGIPRCISLPGSDLAFAKATAWQATHALQSRQTQVTQAATVLNQAGLAAHS